MNRAERIHVHVPGFTDGAAERLRGRLPDREIVAVRDDEHFAELVPEMEVLFCWQPPRGHWARADRLGLIQLTAAGVDSVLPADGLGDDVVVCNASGAHEPQMAEFTWAALLGLAYRIPTHTEQNRLHEWRNVLPRTLDGGTLCVVGLGTIGASIARRASAFGMRVTGVRRSGEPMDGIDLVVTPDRRLEALEGADAVVVVTPLTPETAGLVGEAELAVLAPKAILVDVGRGGVVDHDAVVAALRSEALWGAALDVFPEEPLPAESPLWDEPGLLVTSHTAGHSRAYFHAVIDRFVENLEAWEAGDTPPAAVDRSLGY